MTVSLFEAFEGTTKFLFSIGIMEETKQKYPQVSSYFSTAWQKSLKKYGTYIKLLSDWIGLGNVDNGCSFPLSPCPRQ
jgi:flavoprotein